MEYKELKAEFTQNLKTLDKSNKNSKKYQLDNKNVSIFSYTKELNNFLKTKDKEEIKEASIKTGDILKLDFKDGNFQLKEGEQEEKSPIIGILNDLLNDEKIKSKIDTDGDKKISEKEIKAFLDAIENLDGNKDDISFEDLIKGTEKLQKIDNKNTNTNKPKQSNNAGKSTTGAPYSGAYGGSPSGVNNSAYIPQNVKQTVQKKEGETLEELERQQTEKENDLSNAQKAYDYVFSGNNDKVKAATENLNASKENYEKLLEEEKNLSEEQKTKLKEADKKVEDTTKEVNNAEKALQEAKNAISSQESVISADESNLAALKDSLSTLNGQQTDNAEKQNEINSKISELNGKISEAETKLNEDKTKLEEFKQKETEAQKTLTDKKTENEQAKEEKTKLEQEFIVNNENVSNELKNALKTYQDAEKNVTDVQNSEADIARTAIEKAEKELTEINNKINEKRAEETKKENSVSSSNFSFDFDLNLTDTQSRDLESFKAHFEQNKAKYEEVEKLTGVPASVVAAIHWRESSGDFNTYLHNGEQLGQVTTLVPEGIYFEDWTEAAVDALTREGAKEVNFDNEQETYDFCEAYNGLGYKNKGLASPYVWAGTTNYTGGLYVADGVFDSTVYDPRPGVAVMMKAVS